jgi:two-component system LytT family sensor kinase
LIYVVCAINYYWLLPAHAHQRISLKHYVILTVLITILVSAVFAVFMEVLFDHYLFDKDRIRESASQMRHQVRSQKMEYNYSSLNLDYPLSFLFALFISLIVVPITYFLYLAKHNTNVAITNLKRDLGQSMADKQFLQSQLNPHFLFNSMNTLYGVALAEDATKSAEGIQRLSDMMRFMLHDTQKETIPLAKEVGYITQYIDLQKLRIANRSEIDIQAEFPSDISEDLVILPMLLIPLVENAFKHGISLRHPSWIRIYLKYKSGEINFEIVNSMHRRENRDESEQENSGIGLDNLINRLALFYPNAHKLTLNEDSGEFYASLSLVCSGFVLEKDK